MANIQVALINRAWGGGDIFIDQGHVVSDMVER